MNKINVQFIVLILFGCYLPLLRLVNCSINSQIGKSNWFENVDRKVLVVSLDGFRSDYLETYGSLLGNLSLIANHVRAEYVKPVFPSLTFPNHHSIATGVYTETHGIVHNSFHDPTTGQHFSKTMNETFWNTVEPIWISAERQNIRTAVCMWPGSAVSYRGTRTSYHMLYDEKVSFQRRIDAMLGHMINGDGVKLAMLYFHEPDKTAHYYGPDSREIKKALKLVNDGIGYLLQQINSAKFSNKIDLLIVSDHGLSTIDTHRIIVIDDLIGGREMLGKFFDKTQQWMFSNQKVDAMVYSSVVHLWPYPDKIKLLYHLLKSRNNKNVNIYLKEEIPDEFHYRNNPRIPPIVLVAKPGWQIVLHRDVFEKTFLSIMDGMHGYDSNEPEMRAVFYAMGPSFLSNVVLQPFENVNIYPLIARLAGIRPQPNNGSLDVFVPALKTVPDKKLFKNGAPSGPAQSIVTAYAVINFIVSLTIIAKF